MSTPPARTATSGRAARVVIVVVSAVAVLNGLFYLAGRAAGGVPEGPRGSSYATSPEGAAAYHDLLVRSGFSVQRERDEIAEATLDPAGTLVLLDPRALEPGDAGRLREFVRSGGRLVAGGRVAAVVEPRLAGFELRGPRRPAPMAPVPELAGVVRVVTAGDGSFGPTGPALPALGASGRVVLAVRSDGAGRLVALADTSVVGNEMLARADNAALGIALAGPRDRPVSFVESVHGYGRTSGVGAIPAHWLVAAGLAAAGAGAWMLSAGRRAGPPQLAARQLPPPRRAYVDALAASLARTKRVREAAAPVAVRVRRSVALRAGLASGSDAQAVHAAASSLGLPDDEARAAAGTSDDVIALGRALARLEALR